MKRLFTFGCSFTQYWRWPTWADALGKQFDVFENWGMCGAGNAFIFNSLIECNQRNIINKDDTVCIMWTNTSREDRYVKDQWLGLGNIYWTEFSEVPLDYIKKFACERGYLIRDLAFISATKQLLESWQCHWKFFSMVPLTQTNLSVDLGANTDDLVTYDQDVRELYKHALESIRPSMYETVFDGQWSTNPGIPDTHNPAQRDFHPTPLEHLAYLDRVCPETIIHADTVTWMDKWQSHVLNKTDNWKHQNIPNRL